MQGLFGASPSWERLSQTGYRLESDSVRDWSHRSWRPWTMNPVIVAVHLPDSPLHIVLILCQMSKYCCVLIVWWDSHNAARLTIVQLDESLSTSIIPLLPHTARVSFKGGRGALAPPPPLGSWLTPLRIATNHTYNTCTVPSRKRAHYGMSAHPPLWAQFPAKV